MKNIKSYKSKFKAWFITLIVILIAGSVSAAVICQTQINEVISIAQSEEKKDTKKIDNAVEENKSGDDMEKSEEDFEITKYITPLTTVRVIALGVIVGAWVGMAIWYWLLVAFWMKNRTANAGYNSTLWFILTLFTNLIAVVIYEFLRRIPVVCPRCFHIETRGDYCEHCGTQLKSICPNCGQRLNKNSKYCPTCGNKM